MSNITRCLGVISLLGGCLGLAGCMVGVEDAYTEEGEDVGEAVEAISYNGHDYLFNLIPAKWDQARASCLTNGYYLVSINSSAEESWLQQQETAKGGSYWWIGYSDVGFEGIWLWEDQSNSIYKNWNTGEPNNGGGNENCATDNVTGGRWNDWGCANPAKYICERSL